MNRFNADVRVTLNSGNSSIYPIIVEANDIITAVDVARQAARIESCKVGNKRIAAASVEKIIQVV